MKARRSSTVQHGTWNPVTAGPKVQQNITVERLVGTRVIEIKYIDAAGRECGPYPVVFDAVREMVGFTKQVLEMVPAWIAIQKYEGMLLVYFSTLVSYKNAFREIRYSVDDESLSERVAFEADWSGAGIPGIGPRDQIYIQVPPETRFVCVRLFFADGTESATRKFSADDATIHAS